MRRGLGMWSCFRRHRVLYGGDRLGPRAIEPEKLEGLMKAPVGRMRMNGGKS
jgi:hypothetical protein